MKACPTIAFRPLRQVPGRSLLAAGGVLVLLAGCGRDENLPETAPVSGTVTYRGQPLQGGTVTFHPEDPEAGNPGYGEIQADGKYTLSTYNTNDGAVLGPHVVTVEVFPGQAGGAADGLPGMEATVPSPIPRKYSNPSTSLLRFEVQQGNNTADLKLED